MSRIPPPIFKSESTRTAECDKIVVGVADMAVARDAHKSIVTYALGIYLLNLVIHFLPPLVPHLPHSPFIPPSPLPLLLSSACLVTLSATVRTCLSKQSLTVSIPPLRLPLISSIP